MFDGFHVCSAYNELDITNAIDVFQNLNMLEIHVVQTEHDVRLLQAHADTC